MSKSILLSLIALMAIIGVSFALGPAGTINHTQCIPGTSYNLRLSTGDTLKISSGLVYDTTIFVLTKPDTAEAYIEVFPYLGWPFVEEDKDITIVLDYQNTRQQNMNPKGLYGLDANAGWVYLHGAEERGSNYTFTYQIRSIAAREIYAGRNVRGIFSAFKVDEIR
jgi:hypothetical protein